jgi:hypothetical protein
MSNEREYETLRVQTYRRDNGRWKVQTTYEQCKGPTGLKWGDIFQTEEDKAAGAQGVNDFKQFHEVIAGGSPCGI